MQQHIHNYIAKVQQALSLEAMSKIISLGDAFLEAWIQDRTIYFCGNGGSAGNAIHLANDFIYGVGVKNGGGIRAEALSANPAIITCLANDLGYENIYSEQLRVKARQGDLLIVLSGSGNSPNVVRALETGNNIGMKTFAILGFSGGRCKELAACPIHFEINDMQIAEDLQLIVGHICMQWLCEQNITTHKNDYLMRTDNGR